MDFRECMLCGKTEIIWDLVAMNDTHGKRMGFRCKDGKCALPKSPPKTFFESLDLGDQKPNPDGSYIKSHQRPATSSDFIQETPVHPLQEQYGFQKPEDGSERRFVFNAREARREAAMDCADRDSAVGQVPLLVVPAQCHYSSNDWHAASQYNVQAPRLEQSQDAWPKR